MGDSKIAQTVEASKAAKPVRDAYSPESQLAPHHVSAIEMGLFHAAPVNGRGSSPQHLARVLRRVSPTHQSQLLRQCQRDYGNAYVQRLISQTQRDGTESFDHSAHTVPQDQEIAQTAPLIPPGQGQPLPLEHRVPFEHALAHPLGHVRIHTGSTEDRAAREIQAQAFTVGSDIYFPSDAPEPGTASGDRLLGHELTHVVQHDKGRVPQASSRNVTVSAPRDPLEQEAYAHEASIADAVGTHRRAISETPNMAQGHGAPPSTTSSLQPHVTEQRPWSPEEGSANQALKCGVNKPVIYRDLWDDLGAAYDEQTGALTDAAGNVLEMGEDLFWKVIRSVAPGIVPYIQEIRSKGIIGYLREKASVAFKGIFGGLSNSGGVIAGLIKTFSKLGAAGAEILTALSRGDCQPLFSAVDRLGDTLMAMAGDAWDAIKDFLAPVGDFFSALWDKFSAPAIDFLTEYASDTWENIKALGGLIWDLTAPVRDKLKAAWVWIKEQLGIGEGPEGQDGLLQWVQKNLAEAWKEITAQLEPIIAPMKAFVATIKAILPLDAILNLRETIHGWLKQAGDMVGALNKPQGVTENQEVLRDQILPAIKGSIMGLGSTIAGAGSWVAGQIGGIAETVTGFFSSLQSNTLVGAAAGAIQWVQDKVTMLSEWVQGGVIGLFDTIGQGVAKLSNFVEPVLNVLKKIVSVIGNVVKELPGLVLGPLWKAIPACIREPIKKFIIEHILGAIPIISTFVKIPEIWEKIQKLVMDFLSMVFVKGDLGGAAMMVVRFVLEAVGVDVDQFLRILGKAASAVDEIIMHPVEFMTNLFGALKSGLGQFLSKIAKHLMNGLLGWLLGPLQDLGITPPKELTLGSILDLALQILGVSKDKLLQKVEKAVPGAKRVIDEAWRWISALIQGGLGGLWAEIKTRLSDLWDTIIGGLSKWITLEIVEAGIARLLTMSNPAGAIIEAIRTIYTTLTFLVNKINQIMALVESVVNSLGKIVKGEIEAAASWIEDAMARTVPTILAFFADWLGIDDPAPNIRKIVLGIQTKVDAALDWLVNKAVTLAKAALKLFGTGERAEVDSQESTESKEVKEKVKKALVGKYITDAQQAHALLTSIYKEYKVQGLKGIGLILDSKNPSKVGVKVSASVATIVQNLDLQNPDDVQKLREIAVNMNPFSEYTKLYVFYDADSKPWGDPILNEGGGALHAEQVFERYKVRQLVDFIDLQRKNRKLLAKDGPVPVTLEMNRTPCTNRCIGVIDRIRSIYGKEINLNIKAVGHYGKGTKNYGDFVPKTDLEKLLQTGAEVTALEIWSLLAKKLAAAGFKQMYLRDKEIYTPIQDVGKLASEAWLEEQELKQRLEALNKTKKENDELAGEKLGTGI